jgi:SAM-dependent methyltransferase
MFETILPYVTGRILEIGSGIGNISSHFVNARLPITLTEFDGQYCHMLHEKFDRESLVRGIYQLDLVHSTFEQTYNQLLNSFDTVFALNVVEHIADDKQAITNARSLLASGGRLLILVPAYRALYNGIDRGLDHYRRYTRKSIKNLLSGGFEILSTRYFNLAGVLGWFVSGTVLRKKNLTAGPLSLYNKLVPLFRVVDALAFHQAGLSVIAVARKK